MVYIIILSVCSFGLLFCKTHFTVIFILVLNIILCIGVVDLTVRHGPVGLLIGLVDLFGVDLVLFPGRCTRLSRLGRAQLPVGLGRGCPVVCPTHGPGVRGRLGRWQPPVPAHRVHREDIHGSGVLSDPVRAPVAEGIQGIRSQAAIDAVAIGDWLTVG